MKTHSELSKGHLKTVDTKTTVNNLWKQLVCDLNAVGPSSHDNGWKKVWFDSKTHLKAKMPRNKLSISGTGGCPSSHCTISPLEEQVNELAMEVSVSGISGTLEFGATHLTQPSVSDTTTHVFGVLKARFRCLLAARELHYAPEKVEQILNMH